MTEPKAPILVPLDRIKPYEGNPRRHEDISEIVESIQRVGFRGSIWVDKDMEIIAGHGRYLSALQLGLKEVPVTVMDDLTEAEVKYLRIKDNRASEQLGRRCAMMEYDPKYADVIIERWQNLTGEDAELIEGES